MRKSTVFISAVLTTFALVILYGVVLAYRGTANLTEATTQSTATLPPEATDISASAQSFVTPEQAAQLAAQVVGHDNLLSAESSNINGVDAYKITFTNKDVVYIGLDGQVLSVQVAPVIVNIPPPAKRRDNHNNNSGGGGGNVSSGGGEGEHENHDD